MNTINMPGFTAESSLYNSNVHYQSASEATFYGGVVQPAGDMFDPNREVPSLTPRFGRRGNCLKCVHDLHYVPQLNAWVPSPTCRWVLAIC